MHEAPPRYLILHEFDSPERSGEHLDSVSGTEWSKQVATRATCFPTTVWELIYVAGAEAEGLWKKTQSMICLG